MLIEFRLKNHRSYSGEQVLSLVASSDAELPANCIDAGKLRLLRSAAVYGPNAAGKTNLIGAVNTMRSMVVGSAREEPGSDLPMAPFAFDESTRSKPTSLEVTFLHHGVRYQYGFSATTKEVRDEWLIAYPKGSPQKWFERSYRGQKKGPTWYFGPSLKGDKTTLATKTRRSALFLSVGAQWNHRQLSQVYEWFRDHLRVVSGDIPAPPLTERLLLNERESPAAKRAVHDFVSSFLEDADLGIHGVKVRPWELEEIKAGVPKQVPDPLRSALLAQMEETPPLLVETVHKSTAGKEVTLRLDEESGGTRRLFAYAGHWLLAATKGYTLVVDELASSLHPLLTRELVKFFRAKRGNDRHAQLVFTTHDTNLLDPQLLRRDQIWFVSKESSEGTKLYSLADYRAHRARKGEAYQKGYLAGKYGGLPVLEAFKLK